MKVVIIGCGVMGSALARHFSKKHSVILCDKGSERSASLAKELGAEVYARQADAVEKADAAVLAVKPKDLPTVAKAIAGSLNKDKIVLSVLAGTPLKALSKHFPEGCLVRLMPNLALTCGEGVIGLADDPLLKAEAKKSVEELLEGLGLLTWLPEEKLEALTSIAGSGPAFLFVLIEAMIDSGIYLGFSSEQSRELALKTIEGAAKLLRTTNLHPGQLKWKVASPGGTTIAGLKELENRAVRGAIMETFIAAYERAHKMAEEHN